jgi:hypothetical protein
MMRSGTCESSGESPVSNACQGRLESLGKKAPRTEDSHLPLRDVRYEIRGMFAGSAA